MGRLFDFVASSLIGIACFEFLFDSPFHGRLVETPTWADKIICRCITANPLDNTGGGKKLKKVQAGDLTVDYFVLAHLLKVPHSTSHSMLPINNL